MQLNVMLNNIRDIGLDISINNILYGNSDFAYDVNCSLFTAVHRYILDTKRFVYLICVINKFTLSIFYCQTNTDKGSDTCYKLTRSSPLHINH
jgi:hypothetical protein